MKIPTISILGKPNVGKSTLFNRLIGKRQSIVSPIHGVTRDRIYGEFEWLGQEYSIIDTGGYIPKSDNVVDKQVNLQANIAKESSDLILFMIDGKDEITSSDRILSEIIKKTGKPYILIINKIDTKKQENDNLMKQGIALVQTTVLSHTLHAYFEDRNFDDEILIECRFNERFKKWEPVSLSEGPIDSV